MTTTVLNGFTAGLAALVVLLLALLFMRLRAQRLAEIDAGRTRFLAGLAGSIDLDDVLARVLAGASALIGTDSMLVKLFDPGGGKPVVATFGLSTEEAEAQAAAGFADSRLAPAVAISFAYPEHRVDADDNDMIRSGLAVPLVSEGEAIGYLAAFQRTPETFGEGVTRELESLADLAVPAIANARRFREARRLADLDALTGLHNRRFFHETLGREVIRAHRYGRNLALVVFDLDDFKEVNDRVGHLTGDSVLAEAAERVLGVVRSADIACRVGGDEFAVILPEASLDEADQLYHRIQEAVSARPIGSAGRLYLSAGVAELRPEDDATAFFQRADDALYRAKNAGKGRVVVAANGRKPG
jgi:diguanylate cyclase (GGDEF)-like protein